MSIIIITIFIKQLPITNLLKKYYLNTLQEKFVWLHWNSSEDNDFQSTASELNESFKACWLRH